MTTDQIILFGLFGLVFAMLLWGRFRYDLVAFSALMAGVVVGARCPLVVPSRADSPMTKLFCIALASFVSRMRNDQ